MTWTNEAEFLTTEREADLLASVLSGLNAHNSSDKNAADTILCELIERGLADADRGPAAFQAWLNTDEEIAVTDTPVFTTVRAAYLGEEVEV